jgi:hypothetical protein
VSSTATRSLLTVATFFGGIVAGFSVNRALVDINAWRQMGPDEWARFTRRADLGSGLVLYPAEGIAALATTLGAAAAFYFDRTAPRTASIPVYDAAIGAVVAFAVTRFALAPDTLRIRDAGVDPTHVAHAFQQLQFWWPPKAALHLLTFACNLWSLSAAD